MKLPIYCDPNLERVPRETLVHFQQDLKTLSKEEYEKLRTLLLSKGFRVPIFVWSAPNGETKILDGHQRLKVIEEEGWETEDLPVVRIHADDENEAAQMVLAISSQYARVDPAGLHDFAKEHDIKMPTLSSLSLPEFDMGAFEAAFDTGGVVEKERDARGVITTSADMLSGHSGKIAPVIFAKDVAVFERAMRKTGKTNRAQAIISICQHFLDSDE